MTETTHTVLTVPSNVPAAEAEGVEIRAYTGKETPVLALVVVYTIPRDANGATPETSARYRALARQYDGTEYVADPGGAHEEMTDWDGVCPAEIRRRAEDDDHRREIAREAGMLHGVEGYNEVMGY